MKRVLQVSVACILGGLVIYYALRLVDPLHARPRRRWAAAAIATIQNHIDDPPWLAANVATLRLPKHMRYGAWFNEGMLMASNGEWMACTSVCTKEEQTPLRKDLFIGRGSDGKWYYSTFHFCVNKDVLNMESQPATLSEIVSGYWLLPFDGTPDHCLEETWNGNPNFGAAATQMSGIGS